MTDADLLALDKMGFIPGPGEKEEEFLKRVELTKKKFEQGNWISESHWDWTRTSLDHLFSVKPLYICAFYSNRNLALWQGAASWIQKKQLHSIQLRSSFKKGSFLKIYSREEVLAHEAVHAARSAFDERRYEEFFAYMTSEKKWRRVLGPLLERPWEAWPFLGCLIFGMIWPVSYWGASLWLTIGFSRLIRRHITLSRAGRKILKNIGDLRKMRSILFRLTDQEIELFAGKEDFKMYAQKQNNLRWRVIKNYQ